MAERGTTKRRRLWAILLVAGATISVLAWRSAPDLGRRLSLHRAEVDVAGGRLDEAEARLILLISEKPRDGRPRLLLVQVLRRQGRITEAEEALQRAVELGLPVAEGRREHTLLLAGQDFPRAEPVLRRLLAARPDDAEVRRALGEGTVGLGSRDAPAARR